MLTLLGEVLNVSFLLHKLSRLWDFMWIFRLTPKENALLHNLGVISRIAYLLPSNIRLNLYYSLIYPYFSYCNIANGVVRRGRRGRAAPGDTISRGDSKRKN